MKQSVVIILFLLSIFSVSAQKEARSAVKAGNKAFNEKRYHVAETNYKSAIADDPTSKEAAYNLANAYYKQNKWDEAIKGYQHYLTLENESLDKMGAAWHNIGNTLLKKKDLQQSMEAYKNALRLNPKDDDARYNLAVVQKMIQDQEDQDENQDQNKDQQDKKEQEDKKDQNQDKDQNQNQDKKDKKPEQQENEQMSQENAQQILQAIEQDEKETQEKVKQMKAAERKRQNEDNRRKNKDW